MLPVDRPPLPRWALALAIAAILAAHSLGRVASFCSPIQADSYAYGTIAYRLAEGEVFYRDVADVKPPGLYMLYSLAYRVGHRADRWPMIPVDMLIAFAGYWAVYLLGREIFPGGIALALAVAIAWVTNFFSATDFATDGFGLSEGFMILPAALAVRQYVRGLSRESSACFIWCGFWVGVEFLIKQTALPLTVAIALHWTLFSLTRSGRRSRWIVGTSGMIAGGLVAILPFVIMVFAQGTWYRAYELLFKYAGGMLKRGTGWPTTWENILPLWTPLVWCVLGVVWRLNRSNKPADRSSRVPLRVMSFLCLWVAAEGIMLVYLPLRAYHYYVITALPVVVLGGLFWDELRHVRASLAAQTGRRCLAVAVVLTLVFSKPIPETLGALSYSRMTHYDGDKDRAFFAEVLSWKRKTFGAPEAETP